MKRKTQQRILVVVSLIVIASMVLFTFAYGF